LAEDKLESEDTANTAAADDVPVIPL